MWSMAADVYENIYLGVVQLQGWVVVFQMCGSPEMCVFLFLWPPQLLVRMENILNQMGGKPL